MIDRRAELAGDALLARIEKLKQNDRPTLVVASDDFLYDRVPRSAFSDEGQIVEVSVRIPDWSLTWSQLATCPLDALLRIRPNGGGFLEVCWDHGVVQIPVRILPTENFEAGAPRPGERTKERFTYRPVHDPEPDNYPHVSLAPFCTRSGSGDSCDERRKKAPGKVNAEWETAFFDAFVPQSSVVVHPDSVRRPESAPG